MPINPAWIPGGIPPPLASIIDPGRGGGEGGERGGGNAAREMYTLERIFLSHFLSFFFVLFFELVPSIDKFLPVGKKAKIE